MGETRGEKLGEERRTHDERGERLGERRDERIEET